MVGYKGGFKLLACCPFHHESNPSFAVFENGGYHCKACGVSGLVWRTDGSGDDLLSHLSLERPATNHFLQRNPAPNITSLEPELLNRAYRAALSVLTLRRTERQHLEQRGLSPQDLDVWEARGYRSAPTSWPLRLAVTRAVVAAIGKESARSLPFLQPSAKAPDGLLCADIPGLLVPIYDPQNRIIACKVRLVDDQQKSRFLWWKARHSPASTGAPLHIHHAPTATLAIVVEGPIKADMVATLWPRLFGEAVTVLAIPGATAHAGLSEALEQLSLRRVLLALDPDSAGQKTTEILQSRLAHLTLETASWPAEFGKIDDFLAHPGAPHHQLQRIPHQPEPPAPTQVPFPTLEEARAAARPWLSAALTGPRGSVHHMALEMGGGKTHLAVELINQLYESGKLKGQVGLFTTRHEQGEQFAGTEDWARHYGATYAFHQGEATLMSPCREPRRMLTVVNAGAPTKLACEACPQRSACSSNYSRDPDQPFWLAQRTTSKERHLYNANSLRDPSVISRLSVIVLDDLDLEKTTVDHVFLEADQLRKAILWGQRDLDYAPLLPLLQALWALLPLIPPKRFQHDAPRLNGQALQDALALQVGGLEQLQSDLKMALTAKDPHPLTQLGETRSDVPHRGFLRLAQRLSEELAQRDQSSWNPMVHLKPDGISLWTRARLDFTGKTVIILNAGSGAQQYQRLFPNAQVNVFHGRVAMPNRTHIAQNPVGPYTLKGASQLLEQIIEALDQRQQTHPKESPSDWGLVTTAALRSQIEELYPGINARHYGNQTGSNEMQSVRFLIVAGDFKPNPHSFFEEAQALWGDSPRLDPTSRILRTQIQDKSGKSLGQGRRGYLDPRLDTRWLELTAGEVRQAVGRGRPWNTTSWHPDQGHLLQNSTSARRLDVLLLSSYIAKATNRNIGIQASGLFQGDFGHPLLTLGRSILTGHRAQPHVTQSVTGAKAIELKVFGLFEGPGHLPPFAMDGLLGPGEVLAEVEMNSGHACSSLLFIGTHSKSFGCLTIAGPDVRKVLFESG
ncbi:MAG: CHC2 zinc finger domain-containing protein [Vulcanimicrobiota bacterium]